MRVDARCRHVFTPTAEGDRDESLGEVERRTNVIEIWLNIGRRAPGIILIDQIFYVIIFTDSVLSIIVHDHISGFFNLLLYGITQRLRSRGTRRYTPKDAR
jgi:hypothetical protein